MCSSPLHPPPNVLLVNGGERWAGEEKKLEGERAEVKEGSLRIEKWAAENGRGFQQTAKRSAGRESHWISFLNCRDTQIPLHTPLEIPVAFNTQMVGENYKSPSPTRTSSLF